MHDLIDTLAAWLAASKRLALAMVVGISGTAPRPLGAKLLVTEAGEMVGSVSGGCVEGAVVQEAVDVIRTGKPRRLVYGIADELAQSVGLTCGGQIEVLVIPLTPALAQAMIQAVREARRLVIAVGLEDETLGRVSLWSPDGWHRALNLPELPAASVELLRQELAAPQPQRVAAQPHAFPDDLFLDALLPPFRLVIVGAVHIAVPLVALAKTLGFHTVVVDARSAFATPDRFGHAAELHIGWPADLLPTLALDNRTAVVTLTHDDKLDLPALAYALSSPALYVGALGSRRTLAARLAALRDLGVEETHLARLHAPVGLDLGGRLPEEVALAILAEIVAARHGRVLSAT